MKTNWVLTVPAVVFSPLFCYYSRLCFQAAPHFYQLPPLLSFLPQFSAVEHLLSLCFLGCFLRSSLLASSAASLRLVASSAASLAAPPCDDPGYSHIGDKAFTLHSERATSHATGVIRPLANYA